MQATLSLLTIILFWDEIQNNNETYFIALFFRVIIRYFIYFININCKNFELEDKCKINYIFLYKFIQCILWAEENRNDYFFVKISQSYLLMSFPSFKVICDYKTLLLLCYFVGYLLYLYFKYLYLLEKLHYLSHFIIFSQ